jgi:MerR family transcriptional regulator, thiopeptide resistance regulator
MIPLDSDPGSGITMVNREIDRLYRIHEFAQLAGVTVKALHHYDRLGLLKPRRAGSGYRIYVEHDLERLEQIVALKFLGLPLKQIKILLERDPLQLPEALRMQRTILEEKRRLLDRAIGAIANAENVLQSGQPPGAPVFKKIIEAIGMQTETQDATEFMKNYYRGEAWVRFQARHREWPSHAWHDLFRDIASSLKEDPASERAQALAVRWRELRAADSGGDPKVHAGLMKAWADRQYWPETVQGQFAEFNLYEISQFIAKAFAAYRSKNFGEIVWVKDLDSFTLEEKESFPLATVDLYFKIEESRDHDPAGETGQALAARWMELLESRTGGHPDLKIPYESYLRWMDGWPAPIHRKIRTLSMEKISEFILPAITHAMKP